MNKKSIVIVALTLIFCILMAVVDGLIKADYFIKSAVKLVLFLLLPSVYSLVDKEINIKKLFRPDKAALKGSIALGVFVFAIILGAYTLLKNVFNFSEITGALSANIGVNGRNFVYVSLYISFVNSLLEEFFFRGFSFINLKRVAGRKFAYFFSAGAFALYHIAMMIGWFKMDVFLIVMTGLFAGGLLFNYLDEKSETVFPSWFVHMFANFAINTIGFILFEII